MKMHPKKILGWFCGALQASALLLMACDTEPKPEPQAEAEAEAEDGDDHRVEILSSQGAGRAGLAKPVKSADRRSAEEPDGHGRRSGLRQMPDAERAFAQAVAIIGERYVDPVADDALWTGALDGVMDGLIQLDGHPVNALLSPEELAELMSGTKGTIVGVGVTIELVAEVLVIRGVVPGGAAEAAGLQRGDRILGIDGERISGMDLGAIVQLIRGPAGSDVELFVQRDTEEWQQKLRRDVVAIRNVHSRMLEAGVAYIRLYGFAATTADEFEAALAELNAAGMKKLIIDLRHCPGGLLDAGIAVTSKFLEQGDLVVAIDDRIKGQKMLKATEDGRWRQLPLAVLIGPRTASSAEIFADALAVHAGATLIGAPTMGKGTVESIHELDNGWALRLSSGRFTSAGGLYRLDSRVPPELPIESDDPRLAKRPLDEIDDGSDPVLELARSWLRER